MSDPRKLPIHTGQGLPQDLAAAAPGLFSHVKGLLFDVDDTLTSHGELAPDAYAALHRARDAGLWLCAVTGRGAGWCDLMVRIWPVHAVVGETGAFTYFKGPDGRVTEEFFRAKQLAADRKQRDGVVADVLAAFPAARISRDSAFRLCDVAFDLVEDGPPIPDDTARAILEVLRQRGLTAARSNVHINTWVGQYGKREMVEKILRERGMTADAQVYAGDSRNDGPLFAYFPLSVGVANVRPLLDELRALGQAPAYITQKLAGAGFVELVDTILQQRRGQP